MKKVFSILAVLISHQFYAQVLTVNGLLIPGGTDATQATADQLQIGGPVSDWLTTTFPFSFATTCPGQGVPRTIQDEIERYGKTILIVISPSDCPYCRAAADDANANVMERLNNIRIWYVGSKLAGETSDCGEITYMKSQYPFINNSNYSFLDKTWFDASLTDAGSGGRQHHGSSQTLYWSMPAMPSVYRVVNPRTKKIEGLGYYLPLSSLSNAINNNFNPSPDITVSSQNLSFQESAGVQTINLNTNLSWNVAPESNWISVSQTSGNGSSSLQVSVTGTNTDRKGEILISANGNKRVIFVNQQAIPSTLQLSVNNLSFPNTITQTSFNITSNSTWEITNNLNWVSFNTLYGNGNQTINLTVSPNLSTTMDLNGVITVSAGNLKKTFQVSQQGAVEFMDTPELEISFSNISESKIIEVFSNTNWTFTGLPEWLTIDPINGFGDAQVIVTPTQNNLDEARTASVDLLGYKNTTLKLEFTQQAEATTSLNTTNNLKDNVIVFPNPLDANSEGKLSQKTNFVISNLLGEIVAKYENTNEFNTFGWSSGMYFIKTSNSKPVKIFIK
jgi:hypothetical protein